MTVTYIDTYISCPDETALAAFTLDHAPASYIPVQPGRTAVPAGTDAYDNPTPAIAAAGDPSLYYTCLRTTADISGFIVSPMAVVDAATGQAVVGVFA